MTSPFVGEIRIFGFSFAPTGWALCNGQLLSIGQNTALFSLLGTLYGGDGVSTFGLPNLQSRVPIHMGRGSGLSLYDVGQSGGTETVTLTAAQMPLHSHSLHADVTEANSDAPGGHALARAKTHVYGTRSTLGAALTAESIGDTGDSQPHTNIQPYLTLNFCIALSGIFPARS